MQIYLAGKIGNDDWRHDILPELSSIYYEIADFEKDGVPWPIWRGAFDGRHDYTGPFFISGHGCGHGDNQHGAMVYPDKDEQRNIFNKCKQAIQISDLIFAWIETTNCYGTIAELGYAYALNKRICIAGPKRFPDLWFVYSLASQSSFMEEMDPSYKFIEGDDEDSGWHIPFARHYLYWCADGPPNHREYINSAAWNSRAVTAKERAGNRCQICNRHRNQVILDAHHRTYERLGWELPDDITVLCRDCHDLFEQNKRAQRNGNSVQQPLRKNHRKR